MKNVNAKETVSDYVGLNIHVTHLIVSVVTHQPSPSNKNVFTDNILIRGK